MIIAESRPWFEIPAADGAEVSMPGEIETFLEELVKERFHYHDRLKDEAVAGVADSMADNHLILFEGEGYTRARKRPCA